MDKLVKATSLNVQVGDIVVSSKREGEFPWLAIVDAINSGVPSVILRYNDESRSDWYRLRHLSQLHDSGGGVCFIIGNLYETALDKEVVDSWLAGLSSK